MILRDVDLSTDWDVEADALDARHYYCQNWRSDVSVIIDDSAVLVERVMYSPYGVPFGIPVGDIVSVGGSEPASGTVGTHDSTALTGTYWGSSHNIADLDNDGDVDSADSTILSNNNGASMGWSVLSDVHNRLGYAGYVFDEALADGKWHVRHRVLESVLGRWISRDPLGYVDGLSLTSFGRGNVPRRVDRLGLCSTDCIPEQCLREEYPLLIVGRWWLEQVSNCEVIWPECIRMGFDRALNTQRPANWLIRCQGSCECSDRTIQSTEWGWADIDTTFNCMGCEYRMIVEIWWRSDFIQGTCKPRFFGDDDFPWTEPIMPPITPTPKPQ